jgi:DnaJ-domain-containing protein 1
MATPLPLHHFTFVTDHFAIFNEPRRPWLDPEALKEKFHALTSEHHPDVARDAAVDFAALNAAYNTLLDPRARLRHLLELESPEALARSRQIPGAIADLFVQIGKQRQALDAFLRKQSEAASPLARALLAPEKFAALEELENVLATLNDHQSRFLDELRSLDATWQRDKPGALPRLAEIFQGLSYVSKWTEQVREGIVKLTVE